MPHTGSGSGPDPKVAASRAPWPALGESDMTFEDAILCEIEIEGVKLDGHFQDIAERLGVIAIEREKIDRKIGLFSTAQLAGPATVRGVVVRPEAPLGELKPMERPFV